MQEKDVLLVLACLLYGPGARRGFVLEAPPPPVWEIFASGQSTQRERYHRQTWGKLLEGVKIFWQEKEIDHIAVYIWEEMKAEKAKKRCEERNWPFPLWSGGWLRAWLWCWNCGWIHRVIDPCIRFHPGTSEGVWWREEFIPYVDPYTWLEAKKSCSALLKMIDLESRRRYLHINDDLN